MVNDGRYEGAFCGTDAVETASQCWFIEAYADPTIGKMVAVDGFGARRSQPQRTG